MSAAMKAGAASGLAASPGAKTHGANAPLVQAREVRFS